MNEIEIRESNGTLTVWQFAPGVGPVQWSQGGRTFKLQRIRAVSSPIGPSSTPLLTRTVPYIGIDANPAAHEENTPATRDARKRLARESGANILYYAPRWHEIEPADGVFYFGDLEEKVVASEKYGWPLSVNIRIIDTDKKTVPNVYAGWALNDPRMIDRYKRMLTILAPRTRGRVRWISLGNEVNDYLAGNRAEIARYAQLLSAVIPVAKQAFPGAQVSVNYTWHAASKINTDFGAITSQLDFLSFTYYPLNADITFRPAANAARDIGDLVRVAGNRRVFLQEVGYSSSPNVGSSEAAQAEFVRSVFQGLRQNPSIIAANFVWMCDLSQDILNLVATGYSAVGSANFWHFLATLGYIDRTGRAKPGWHALVQEATALR
ncbi:MAG: hypothetical protein FJW39_13655 [Acidobacteria bacterium]|nr:hypothetical protein [Acidobacteriota bacterium]